MEHRQKVKELSILTAAVVVLGAAIGLAAGLGHHDDLVGLIKATSIGGGVGVAFFIALVVLG